MSQLQSTRESINNALAALEAETHEVVQGSIQLNDNLVRAGKKIWRQVLVIWAVGIALAISYFFVLSRSTTTNPGFMQPASQQSANAIPGPEVSAESAQQVSKVLPVSPPLEQEDLTKLLSQIREAQLKKDIHMFMEAYSPDFPELAQKKESTLTIWKKYTYVDSQFKLTDLHQENPSTIIGKVIWNIKVQDQKTGTMRTITRSYFVTFSKESGKWLIQHIKKIVT